MGFKSATAQNLALAASGAFVLADDIDLKAVTGTEGNYSIASGTLTADDVTISGGKLNVLAGDYSSSTANINVASGSLTIGAKTPAYLDANNEAIAAKLSLTDLEIGESGAVSVFSNGTFNVTTLTTAQPTEGNGLTIDGTMSVAGSAASGDNYGVKLASGSITVNQGGMLSFGEAATAAITLDSTKENDQFTVAADTFASGAIILSGGEVQFAFNSGDVFDADAISELRHEVFNKTDALDGFINLGAGQLEFADNISGGTVAWDDLKPYSDIIADTTNFDLQNATVTGITDGDAVQGNVGALQASGDVTTINIKGNTVLNDADGENNAFASNESGDVIGVTIKSGADLTLKNGGNIGAVTFANGGDFLVESVAATSGEDADGNPTITYGTTIASISGASTVTFSTGSSLVEGTTVAEQLITQAGTETVFSGAATIGDGNNDETSVLNGTTTFKAAATFKQDAELVGETSFEKGVTFSGDTYITGDTDVTSGGATFYAGAEISNGAILTADTVTVSGNGLIFNVGTDSAEEGATGTGYLEADLFDLKGNDLFIDPSYDEPTSVAAIKDFGASGSDTDAGTVNGRIFVGKNAALMVGDSASVAAMKEFIAQYQQNGSLVQDQVGAVMYLTDKLTVADGSRIILDAQNTKDEILWNADNDVYGASGTDADLYLGQNTVLAISDDILDDDAAIHFDKSGASIMAQDDSAKIVLDGSRFLNSRNITLFTDSENDGVLVLGDNDIRVETLNGVMYFTLEAGTETTGGILTLDTSKINTAFSAATDESRDLLLAYVSRTANWSEYYTQEAGANIKQERLVAGVASADEAILDNGAITVKDQNLSQEDFVVIDGVVYRLAHNDFLEAVARNTDGKALDSAALQGVFAGSAQAVMLAAQTSQDAIAGRTGVGASTSALTFADNGQGAGLWINPIYVSQDADGFAVQNKDYGVDIDLYGVALGGDYTLANGVRLGAFFNVGTGEADGSGQADQVSNDFDYWGFGIYAGYSTGAFSVVGDFSYSLVDSDVETNTSVGKLTSSYDTDNISLGITGQYKFEVAGTVITPHLGLRYSSINIDDFDIQAEGYSDGGSFDSNRLNVFSIPVGVTIAKEFAVDSWMVKPSFDLTLTGNFGDDEIESRNSWEGVANWQSNYTAEFLDNFTYGATLGVAAKTGNFSLGVGISYTGSENTDAFNATANARLTF